MKSEPLSDQDAAIERAAVALQQMWENEGIEDGRDPSDGSLVGDPTPWTDLDESDRESWRTWARIARAASPAADTSLDGSVEN